MSFETRFQTYLSSLHDVFVDKRRRDRFDTCCSGLNLSLERKGVEPMAAALEPHNVAAAHQNLQHFVADAPWSDAALLERIELLTVAPGHEPVSVEALACALSARRWRAVTWREGTNTELSGRFA